MSRTVKAASLTSQLLLTAVSAKRAPDLCDGSECQGGVTTLLTLVLRSSFAHAQTKSA